MYRSMYFIGYIQDGLSIPLSYQPCPYGMRDDFISDEVMDVKWMSFDEAMAACKPEIARRSWNRSTPTSQNELNRQRHGNHVVPTPFERTIVRTASYAPSAPLSAPLYRSDSFRSGCARRIVPGRATSTIIRTGRRRTVLKVEGSREGGVDGPAACENDENRWRLRDSILIRANQGGMGNLDTTNGKRAEDLLADLAKHIFGTDSDLLALLEERLEGYGLSRTVRPGPDDAVAAASRYYLSSNSFNERTT
jgi:hypothetical protein